MKSVLIVLLTLVVLKVGAQQPYVIDGSIEIPGADKITLNWYNVETGKHLDTTAVVNGKFHFAGNVAKKQNAQIIYKSLEGMDVSILLYLEKRNIKIEYPKGNKYPVLSGTPTNKELYQYNKQLFRMLDSVNALRPGKAPYAWWSREIMPEKIKVITSFIQQNPGSQVSIDQLEQYAIRNQVPDTIELLFHKLSKSLQTSTQGQMLMTRVKGMRSTDVGDVAPQFSLPDTLGNTVSLSSLKGKYVFIDFWATWCGPCMGEMPNLVSAYKKYKGNKFEILGVSLDLPGTGAKWKNIIRQSKMEWLQVSDLKGWECKAALAYYVNAVPANFLLDPNGKIIAKNLRGDALQKTLAELFK